MSRVSEQLTYEKTAETYPSYGYIKLLPQTGSQTETVTVAGAQQTVFEIANNVINLSRSYLTFTMTPAAPGAGVYNWTWKDVIACFQRVELMTTSGIRIVDAQNRSEEHTSELQSLMRISYAVLCLKKKNQQYTNDHNEDSNL